MKQDDPKYGLRSRVRQLQLFTERSTRRKAEVFSNDHECCFDRFLTNEGKPASFACRYTLCFYEW